MTNLDEPTKQAVWQEATKDTENPSEITSDFTGQAQRIKIRRLRIWDLRITNDE